MIKIILFLQIILTPVGAFCAQVTLAWTKNTEPDIAGYKIFSRQENNTYNFTKPLWQGLGTRLIVQDLDDNKGYYFRVRSYNKSGIESVNSNEVYYHTPSIPSPPADEGPVPDQNPSTPDQDSIIPNQEDESANDIIDHSNSASYQVSSLGTGERYYLDRSFILNSIPTGLSTGTEKWIKTRNDDKNQNSEDFLTFTIYQNATIYVGYDSRATGLPNWLSSTFELTSMKIGVSETMGHFKVYRQNFSAGTISLGGNLASGAKNVFSNYIVIIQPNASNPALIFSPESISFTVAEGGTESQSINIGASNGYVANYRISDGAAWLGVNPANGKTPDNLHISVDTGGLAPGTYHATITAVADGFNSDTVPVTLTVTGSDIRPIEITILTPASYEVALLDSGDRYYLDREYILTSIPSGLSTGTEKWIQTRNDDKNPNSEDFLTFTISRDATVYIGYDSRATQLPDWLSSTYESTSMTIGVSEGMEYFDVYQRNFSAGTVSMGGNLASGAENVFSNYIVIIQPNASDPELRYASSDPEMASTIDIGDQSTQDNIKSISLEDGQNLRVESSAGTKISKLEIKETPSSSNTPSDDLNFTFGLIDLEIEDIDISGSTIVKLYLPEGATPETYYKYGPTPDQPEDHWYEFMYDGETGAEIDQNIITLHYVDGKRGDDNIYVADDKISDTNGGAVFRKSQSIPTETTAAGINSNSDGGCFLRSLN